MLCTICRKPLHPVKDDSYVYRTAVAMVRDTDTPQWAKMPVHKKCLLDLDMLVITNRIRKAAGHPHELPPELIPLPMLRYTTETVFGTPPSHINCKCKSQILGRSADLIIIDDIVDDIEQQGLTWDKNYLTTLIKGGFLNGETTKNGISNDPSC